MLLQIVTSCLSLGLCGKMTPTAEKMPPEMLGRCSSKIRPFQYNVNIASSMSVSNETWGCWCSTRDIGKIILSNLEPWKQSSQLSGCMLPSQSVSLTPPHTLLNGNSASYHCTHTRALIAFPINCSPVTLSTLFQQSHSHNPSPQKCKPPTPSCLLQDSKHIIFCTMC